MTAAAYLVIMAAVLWSSFVAVLGWAAHAMGGGCLYIVAALVFLAAVVGGVVAVRARDRA